MVSQAELISKRYHSLVSGLISIFLETVWVPLRFAAADESHFLCWTLVHPFWFLPVFSMSTLIAVAAFCLALETEVFSCLLTASIHISAFMVIAESLLGGRPTRVAVPLQMC